MEEYKFAQQLNWKQRIIYFINKFLTKKAFLFKKNEIKYYLYIKFLDVCHLKRKLFNSTLYKKGVN